MLLILTPALRQRRTAQANLAHNFLRRDEGGSRNAPVGLQIPGEQSQKDSYERTHTELYIYDGPSGLWNEFSYAYRGKGITIIIVREKH